MSTKSCAGCPNTLHGISFLKCCRCPDSYHYTCLNIKKQDFSAFSKEFKETWVCPSCRCREPKRGDNSNTPIRSSATVTPASKTLDNAPSIQHENVTLRSKPRSGSSNCGCLSADIIRDIIREELDRKFNTEIKDIQSKLSHLDESLAFFSAEQVKINEEREKHKSLIIKLQNENEQLRTTTRELAHRLHQVEQLSRTNNLEIQCVPEHKTENLYTTVQQLANTIKCPITESDVQYCSRIAKYNTNSPRPRSILVKFSSRRLRDCFLAGVIKFNKNNQSNKLNTSHLGFGDNKNSPVFVTEHLTPQTKSLHAAARQKAKELHYKFIWVRDGKVFLRKSETSNFILVKDTEVLKSLDK